MNDTDSFEIFNNTPNLEKLTEQELLKIGEILNHIQKNILHNHSIG